MGGGVWVPGTGWAWVAGRRYANAWVTLARAHGRLRLRRLGAHAPRHGAGTAVIGDFAMVVPTCTVASFARAVMRSRITCTRTSCMTATLIPRRREPHHAQLLVWLAAAAHIAASPRVLLGELSRPAATAQPCRARTLPRLRPPRVALRAAASFLGRARPSSDRMNNAYARSGSGRVAPRPSQHLFVQQHAPATPTRVVPLRALPATSAAELTRGPRAMAPTACHPRRARRRVRILIPCAELRARSARYYSAPSSASRMTPAPATHFSAPSCSYSAPAAQLTPRRPRACSMPAVRTRLPLVPIPPLPFFTLTRGADIHA